LTGQQWQCLTNRTTTPPTSTPRSRHGAALVEADVACFQAGTGIATEHGKVMVEAIRVGDKVRVLLGDGLAPVIWVGRREVVLPPSRNVPFARS